MATAEAISHPHDRHSRRRPFTAFMKRLANLKTSSESGSNAVQRNKKSSPPKNNPYPISGKSNHVQASAHSPLSGRSFDDQSHLQSKESLSVLREQRASSTNGNKSAAPTVSTKADTTYSDAAQSKAGTVNTAGGGVSSYGIGGEGSTFSSPAPSVRSLTTTLTTIQSAAPVTVMAGATNHPAQSSSGHQSVHFSHQFPSSPPASAIPSHVVGHPPGGHPSTYNTATANNLLTDNASILTLASSSKRRRRNSLDTNASVRALAPSSIFGGSRESLPLSVLSSQVGEANTGLSAVHNRPSVGGVPAAERASVYSSTGIIPALTSERSSYYANKQSNAGDGASVRSGLVGHGRNDSITGSIGGQGTPLTTPRENGAPSKPNQRNSPWEEVDEEAGHDGNGS